MAARQQSAPKPAQASRSQGVQHIHDDNDHEMAEEETIAGGAEPTTPEYVASQAEAEETVVAAGDKGTAAILHDSDRGDLGIGEDEPMPSRNEIVRMRDMLDKMLGRGGAEPAKPQQSIHITAGEVPISVEATKALSFADAARKCRVKKEDLLSYAVRQATGPDGDPYGPKYLRFVRKDGSKGAIELDS